MKKPIIEMLFHYDNENTHSKKGWEYARYQVCGLQNKDEKYIKNHKSKSPYHKEVGRVGDVFQSHQMFKSGLSEYWDSTFTYIYGTGVGMFERKVFERQNLSYEDAKAKGLIEVTFLDLNLDTNLIRIPIYQNPTRGYKKITEDEASDSYHF